MPSVPSAPVRSGRNSTRTWPAASPAPPTPSNAGSSLPPETTHARISPPRRPRPAGRCKPNDRLQVDADGPNLRRIARFHIAEQPGRGVQVGGLADEVGAEPRGDVPPFTGHARERLR